MAARFRVTTRRRLPRIDKEDTILKATTPIEVIRKALAVLKEKGWTQGQYHDQTTDRYCVVGALEAALDLYGSDKDSPAEYEEKIRLFRKTNAILNDTVVAETNGMVTGVIGYNDTDGRTFSDIRKMLMSAIRRAKEAN